MSKIIDLTGQRFSKLIVIKQAGKDKFSAVRWLCKCDCGNFCTVLSGNLRRKMQKSCGCLRHRHPWNYTHGQSHKGNRLYRIWTDTKTRCSNKNRKCYPDYGGRGITVCTEWNSSFKAFRDWAMSGGYAEDLSIDRIDNNGNYEPGNCRWVSLQKQSNNRRSNRIVLVNGKQMTAAEAARELNMKYQSFMKKLNRGTLIGVTEAI